LSEAGSNPISKSPFGFILSVRVKILTMQIAQNAKNLTH